VNCDALVNREREVGREKFTGKLDEKNLARNATGLVVYVIEKMRPEENDTRAMAALQGAIVHEVGIAVSILESVEAEARRRPDTRFAALGVRIGELSNVDRDALSFAFDALTRKTALENLRLEIEWCPRRQKCLNCEEEFRVCEFDLNCPKCGGNKTSCIGGTELDIAYLELEESCVKL